MGGIVPKKDLEDYGLGENRDFNNCRQDELDFVFQNIDSPWEGLEPEKREPKVRFYVDIDQDLNCLLTEKARELKKSKSELVRELLDRALHK